VNEFHSELAEREAWRNPRCPQATVASISGKALLAIQSFVRHHHGVDAFDRIQLRMSARQRQELGGIVLPTSWYPTATVIKTLEVGRVLYGPADFYERYGEWSANYALNAFYKFLLRFKTPHWILQRSMTMWRNYHTTGEWKMEMTPNSFHGSLHGFTMPGTYCRVLIGWIRNAGRLTGATNCEVTHPRCRAAGATDCLFVGRWT
jgi:hypothetical protein